MAHIESSQVPWPTAILAGQGLESDDFGTEETGQREQTEGVCSRKTVCKKSQRRGAHFATTSPLKWL